MSKSVKINNVTYPDVPLVEIPLATGSGNAKFYDISDATINSNGQMLAGVTSHGADGTLYTGSIPVRASTDVTPYGANIIIPDGYYASEFAASVAPGSVTAPASISGTSASISTTSTTLTLSKTISNTPNVTQAGYISSGTAGNSNVSLTASVTTKGTATIPPSSSNQTIASGTYLTGVQTIAGVTTSNLIASNIVAGITVKVGYSGDDDCVASVTGTAQTPSISQDQITRILSIS